MSVERAAIRWQCVSAREHFFDDRACCVTISMSVHSTQGIRRSFWCVLVCVFGLCAIFLSHFWRRIQSIFLLAILLLILIMTFIHRSTNLSISSCYEKRTRREPNESRTFNEKSARVCARVWLCVCVRVFVCDMNGRAVGGCEQWKEQLVEIIFSPFFLSAVVFFSHDPCSYTNSTVLRAMTNGTFRGHLCAIPYCLLHFRLSNRRVFFFFIHRIRWLFRLRFPCAAVINIRHSMWFLSIWNS